MYRSGTIVFSIFTYFLLLLTLSFQNCTSSAPSVNFSSAPSIEVQTSVVAGGDGDGYLGKPEEGDYLRTFPNYQCPQNSLGTQGSASATAQQLILKADSCQDLNFPMSFLDSRLDFSVYNRDYIGVGSAIFERMKLRPEELPITEAFCRRKEVNAGFDVVIKVNNSLNQVQAKIYRGEKMPNSSQWLVEYVPGFSVSRTFNMAELIYATESFILNIDETSAYKSLYSARLTAKVGGKVYDYAMICRQSIDAPIDLSEPWELNSAWIDTTGLMGYWKLNESISDAGIVVDSSGRGHDGTFISADPPTMFKNILGKVLGAFTFDDGRVESVTIPPHIDFEPPSTLSIGMWVKYATAPAADQAIFGNTEGNGYYLESYNGVTGLTLSISGTGFVQCGVPPATIQVNRWYHFVGTYDTFNMKFYLDGQLVNTCANAGLPVYSNNAYLCIGAEATSSGCSGGGPGFTGAVDDAFIFNRALSAAEIELIYNRQSHLIK